MTRRVEITVRCVVCKATRIVDEAESRRLSDEMDVPMCDRCHGLMLAESATATDDDEISA